MMANPKKPAPVLSTGIRGPAATGAIVTVPLAPRKVTEHVGKTVGHPGPGLGHGKLRAESDPLGVAGQHPGLAAGGQEGHSQVPEGGRPAALSEHRCPIPPSLRWPWRWHGSAGMPGERADVLVIRMHQVS